MIFGDKLQPRLLPGHGAAEQSKLHHDGLVDDVVLISDYDCVTGWRKLVPQEAALAGALSGGVIAAISPGADPDAISIFNPFGLGVLVLPLGNYAYELAMERGMGTEIRSFFDAA